MSPVYLLFMLNILYQPGDIIAFYGTNFISRVIEWVTHGPSHVGVVSTLNGVPVLVESTSLCEHPCLVRGERVMGVQVHRIDERLRDYACKASLYRLLPAWALDQTEQERLRRWLFWFVENGSTYDFARAALSSSKMLRSSLHPDAGTQFCSELCAGAYMRLGIFPMSDPASYTPGRFCSMLEEVGVAAKVSLS